MKAVSTILALAIIGVAFAEMPATAQTISAQDFPKPYRDDPAPVMGLPTQDAQKPFVYDAVGNTLPVQAQDKTTTPLQQRAPVGSKETKTASEPISAAKPVLNQTTAPAIPVAKSDPDIG